MGFIGAAVTGIFGSGVIGQVVSSIAVSYATSAVTNALFGKRAGSSSPTYSIGALQTQTNSNMVMPIIYGKVKCAGNNLWQDGSGSSVNRLVGFGLGKNKGVYDVRLDDKQIESLSGCNYTAYMGDGAQQIDNRVTGETQKDKARLVGGMKYDAYLALTIKASDQISSNPNVTAIWEGRIVKIYSVTAQDGYTLDLKTGYFFKEEWNDNVWCALDFMTGWYGCNIPITDIDIRSFITAAAYAQPGDGTRNWSINLILDEKQSRQDWLNSMLLCFRAWRTYQNGKHGILIDKPESVSKIFKVKKTETIRHDWQELSKDYERIIVKYIDPSYEWQKVGAPATIKPPFRNATYDENGNIVSNGIPLSKTIEINGITNFKQASQMAWFIVNQAQTCQDVITYECNNRALNCTIGDVVGIEDPITQIHEEGLTYKRYRVIIKTEPQSMKNILGLIEYNEALYTNEQGSVAPVVNVTKLPNPMNTPPDATNLFVEEHSRDQGNGTVINDLYLTFDPPNYVFYSHSEVYIKDSNPAVDEIGTVPDALADKPYDEIADALNNWKFVGNAVDKITITNLIKGHEYSIKVVSVTKTYNIKSNFNNAPTIKYTIEGKTLQPYPPTGLMVTITDVATVTWDKASQGDIDFSELRTDKSVGADIGKLAKTSANKAVVTLPSRSGSVYLYHHNTAGKYSDPAEYGYNKPKPVVPTNVKVTPVVQGFVVSCDALPPYCSGINVHVFDGNGTTTYLSQNTTYRHPSNGGVYTVQVAYVDLFGEGILSAAQEVKVEVYIDPKLIAAESLSLEKMDTQIKTAVAQANAAAKQEDLAELSVSVNSITQTVTSNKTTQDGVNQNLVSQINVQAGQITQVTSDVQGAYSAISQNTADIQLRVASSDFNGAKIVNLINLSPAGTLISGNFFHVTAQTLFDNNVVVKGYWQGNTIGANYLQVDSLSALTAKIGTLRTATTGARTEIKDNLIEVYDANNVLRVRMGVW